MILYSIRRISDGKFFVHYNGLGDLNMNSTPVFWKTPGSVWDNLKRLCSQYEPWADRWGFMQKGWVDFDARKLKQWEVIVTDVKVLGEKQIPAAQFVVVKDLRSRDVRIRKYPKAA